MSAVREDPDELGYYAGGNFPPSGGNRKRPFHGGFPDVTSNEFIGCDFLADVKPPSSLTICHLILHPTEQVRINTAARLAHDGLESYAERQRVLANYDNLKHRPDADRRSGTI